MLITHFIGLAMGVGAGFAMLFLSKAASKMEKEEAQKFMLNSLGVLIMGKIGLTLLVLSGLVLMMPHLSHMATIPMFHVKLTLVAIFIGLFVIGSINAKKAKASGGREIMAKAKKLGHIMLALGILIIVFAVLAFN